jgi:hypothetical protein
MRISIQPSSKKSPFLLAPATLLIVFFAVTPAPAGTIFSNFGPGNQYDSYGWIVSAVPEYQFSHTVAMGFTAGANYTVTQIGVALRVEAASDSNSIMLSIDDSLDGVPGTPLETWDVAGLSETSGIVTVTPLTQIDLVAGMQYWIVGDASQSNILTIIDWENSNLGNLGAVSENDNGVGWSSSENTQSAFDVQGFISTPDPACILLATVGLGLLLLVRQMSCSSFDFDVVPRPDSEGAKWQRNSF